MSSSKTGQIEENVHSVNMANSVSEERRLQKKRAVGISLKVHHTKGQLLIDLVTKSSYYNMTLIWEIIFILWNTVVQMPFKIHFGYFHWCKNLTQYYKERNGYLGNNFENALNSLSSGRLRTKAEWQPLQHFIEEL